MGKEDEDLINRMPSHPLSDRELQETRHSNYKIIDKMVSSDDIRDAIRKIEQLWAYFGWLPATLGNWKKLAVALALAVLIGGQAFIDRLAAWAGTFTP